MTGRELLAKLAHLEDAELDLPVIAVGVNVPDMEGPKVGLERLVEYPWVPTPRLEICCLDVEVTNHRTAAARAGVVETGNDLGPGGTGPRSS